MDDHDGHDLEYHEPRPPRPRSTRPPALAMATRMMSFLLIGIGVAIIVRTAQSAGLAFAVGYLYGLMVIAAGIARLYLAVRMGRER